MPFSKQEIRANARCYGRVHQLNAPGHKLRDKRETGAFPKISRFQTSDHLIAYNLFTSRDRVFKIQNGRYKTNNNLFYFSPQYDDSAPCDFAEYLQQQLMKKFK